MDLRDIYYAEWVSKALVRGKKGVSPSADCQPHPPPTPPTHTHRKTERKRERERDMNNIQPSTLER